MNNWVILNIGFWICGVVASIGCKDIGGLFFPLVTTILSGIFYALRYM